LPPFSPFTFVPRRLPLRRTTTALNFSQTSIGLCAVYARRADTQTIERLFSQFGENPPAPTVADKQRDVYAETGPNGKTHTVSYIWTTPGTPNKLLFMLTTAESTTAELQAQGTVSVLGN